MVQGSVNWILEHYVSHEHEQDDPTVATWISYCSSDGDDHYSSILVARPFIIELISLS